MSTQVYADNVLRERWDDNTRTYTAYDDKGAQTSTRPYTEAEDTDADQRRDTDARLVDHEARITALEKIVLATIVPPAAGSEPTFKVLTGRQNGAIYTGQRFTWTDGHVWVATTGPLNSKATPVTYPLGYRDTTPPPPDTPAWKAGTTYKTNDLVTYDGVTYKCVQGHTSQTGWEPPNVAALWTLV